MTEGPARDSGALLLTSRLFGDGEMTAIFTPERTVEGWLAVERSLAHVQAELGVLSRNDALAIEHAAHLDNIDLDRLWTESRNVGYPILPLVRMIAAATPEGPNGRVHFGATTQDIMDTGLSLQLAAALNRFEALVNRAGETLAGLVLDHRRTVMAARTHGQQAVPTTLGAKLAVFLDEFGRHRDRMSSARPRICRISLFGAGGTSAALGPHANEIRRRMAKSLGLAQADVSWHVARDGVAEFGQLAAGLAATSTRLAREIIDLSRTEIGEVAESAGYHRGASSTMPQKANPIGSEAVIGMGVTATALSAALYRAMEATHERAAGEWQIEWQVLPQLAGAAAASLSTIGDVIADLQVWPERLRANLTHDDGLLMAEAYMFRLAGRLGRERAHDLVYTAASQARIDGVGLRPAISSVAAAEGVAEQVEAVLSGQPLIADDYVGDAPAMCDRALEQWRRRSPGPVPTDSRVTARNPDA